MRESDQLAAEQRAVRPLLSQRGVSDAGGERNRRDFWSSCEFHFPYLFIIVSNSVSNSLPISVL